MKQKRPMAPKAGNRNSKVLASIWNDFVNPEKRMRSEGPFLLEHIGNASKPVLDACLGTGTDSIYLLKRGYQVMSNEIDPDFRKEAIETAEREGVELHVVGYDWRKLRNHFRNQRGTGGRPLRFGAVLCLGNSLTYLFKREDQLMALHNFKSVLHEDGTLILDMRNYEYMLDNAAAILDGGAFRYSGGYVYCGIDKVRARPIEISEGRVRLGFLHFASSQTAFLDLYPFRVSEVLELLNRTRFGGVEVFSDYKPGVDPDADFFQFVCRK